MHAPLSTITPRVQRKCDCPGGAANCDCKKKMQKKSRGSPQHDDVYEREADRFAEQNAPHLDLRNPQLAGHDFSRVRIHDDAHAHARADAENARAFTYGHDIYFARGELARPDARQLVAHELAHTVQQGAATTVRKKDPVACTKEQINHLDVAEIRAYTWVQYAIRKLGQYVADPKKNEDVRAALGEYFSSDPDYVNALIARLGMIRDGLRSQGRKATIHCAAKDEPQCEGPVAYTMGEEIFVCQGTLGMSSETGLNAFATILVHEAAHAFAKNLGGMGTATDRGYVGARIFRFLTPEEAFDNAESYAMFVQQLSGEKTGFTRRKETDEIGCGQNNGILALAIARVEQWNLEVLKELSEKDQTSFEADYGALFPRPHPTLIDVRRVFSRSKDLIAGKLTATCVGQSPLCPGNLSFFWGKGGPTAALQICPAYFNVPEEKRVYDTYRMIFQYTARMTAQEAAPYLGIVRAQGVTSKLRGPAAQLPLEDKTPKVLQKDQASYRALVILAGQATIALTANDRDDVVKLVRELESNLIAPNMIIRFDGDPGVPPRYSSLTNTLQIPSGKMNDANMMLGLLRETMRMRHAGREEMNAPESGKGGGAMPIGEMTSMQGGLLDVLVRAGIVSDRPAAQQAIGTAAREELAAFRAAPQTTIYPILVSAAGEASLQDGSDDGVSLGTIPPGMRALTDVEQLLRSQLRKRARKAIDDAAKSSSVITFRVYQWGKKVFEFEVTP